MTCSAVRLCRQQSLHQLQSLVLQSMVVRSQQCWQHRLDICHEVGQLCSSPLQDLQQQRLQHACYPGEGVQQGGSQNVNQGLVKGCQTFQTVYKPVRPKSHTLSAVLQTDIVSSKGCNILITSLSKLLDKITCIACCPAVLLAGAALPLAL